MNRLYSGDNLDVLRRHVEDESVDLVYLDPPFNSNASDGANDVCFNNVARKTELSTDKHG